MTPLADRYLFIGGSTKCGTTSLFKYLQFHPQICPCGMKESRFFWTRDYPIESAPRIELDVSSFDELFFNYKPGQVKLEATPDYLYSEKSAKRILELKGEKKFIFIIRNPIDRFYSWYNYARKVELISIDVTPLEFLEMQMTGFDETTPQHLRSLEQGKYSEYIEKYYKLFGIDNVKVVFFDDLKSDPKGLCMDICRFADINTDYFENFSFRAHNQSNPVHSMRVHKLFRNVQRKFRPLTHNLPRPVSKRIKLVGRSIESTYMLINHKKNAEVNADKSSAVLTYLEDYYQEEANKLRELLGETPPWFAEVSK